MTPLSSPSHLQRYQELSHSGTGSDNYQGLDTPPYPNLSFESPPAMCVVPTLIIQIPYSSSCLSTYQSPISSSYSRRMCLQWSMSPRQFLLCIIYSSIKTPRTKLCTPGLVHLHLRFLQCPTHRTNFLAPSIWNQFSSVPGQAPWKWLSSFESRSLAPLSCTRFFLKFFEELRRPVAALQSLSLLLCWRLDGFQLTVLLTVNDVMTAAYSWSLLVTSFINKPPSIRITSGLTRFNRSNRTKGTGSFLDKILISATFSTGNSGCPGIRLSWLIQPSRQEKCFTCLFV